MRALVVSVHDVSPLTQASCDKILQTLRSLGVSEGSLLIIPNHHSKAPVRDDAAFKDWVSDLVGQGYEPVLHGYYHARTPKPTDAGITKFTTQVYTAGEGEFFDLDRDEAMTRLQMGIDDLSFLDRRLTWICGAGLASRVRSRSGRTQDRVLLYYQCGIR